MRTLIIPCAGNRIINDKPLLLNKHPDGKLLAEKSISGVHPENYDRIIFTVVGEFEKVYNISSIVKDSLKSRYNVEFCILEEQTSGPADTVYETLCKMNVNGEFAVRDSLNHIEVSKGLSGNYIAGLDLTLFDEEVYKVRTKSFILLNEQKQVLDVIEKKFKSDVISVGLYGFKSVDDFMIAYKKLKDKNYPIKKLYLSNIISYLIGYYNRVFKCDIVTKHEDWGSEESWRLLQGKYKMCIINLEQFGESSILIDNIIDIVKKYKNYEKKSFVLLTSKSNTNEIDVKGALNAAGIRCLGIIDNMPVTESIEIINDESELKRAMVEV